jgi:hypothetical protein
MKSPPIIQSPGGKHKMVEGPEILGQRGDNLVLRSFLVTGNYASRPAGPAAQNLHCQVPESACSV